MSLKNITTLSLAAAAMFAALSATSSVNAGGLAERRIDARVNANSQQYFKCSKFSLRVYSACLEQAGNQSSKIRSCRASYTSNLARCRSSAAEG